MDDVLIFSRSLQEHIKDIKEVLNLLRKAGLCVKLKKKFNWCPPTPDKQVRYGLGRSPLWLIGALAPDNQVRFGCSPGPLKPGDWDQDNDSVVGASSSPSPSEALGNCRRFLRSIFSDLLKQPCGCCSFDGASSLRQRSSIFI